MGYDEAGGLGEGWGDFFSLLLRQRSEYTRSSVPDLAFGDWASAKPTGLRRYKYSLDLRVHPETYSWLDKPDYLDVHYIGPVWTAALYEVYWNLRDKLPFTDNWLSVSLDHANTLMLRIITLGMQLQPCMPTFTIARDAVLQAERIITGGKYQCDVWRGFAKRGLGFGAMLQLDADGLIEGRVESKEVPTVCIL